MASLPRTLPPAPSIIIVRLSSLREVLHGLPVVCALRRRYPTARVTWVVEEPFAAVLDGHRAVSRTIRVPRGWLRSPAAVLRLRRELATEAFDVAIDLQGLTKSAVAARLSGARWRIGAAGADGRELSRWLNNDLVSIRAGHAIDHFLALLRPLGICDSEVEFNLPVWPGAARTISRFLNDRRLPCGGFAMIHPAADARSREWPAEHYAALAERLGEHLGLPTVTTWTDTRQREVARTIVEESGGWARLAPATSLHELAELARRGAFVVGSDAAPLHLAVAAGARCISLHGPTRASRTGAYGPRNLRLQAFYDDRAPHRRRGDSDNRALAAISADTVCSACTRLLLAGRTEDSASLAAA
jgi:ADP-heptose:LPS heptosyltransferase